MLHTIQVYFLLFMAYSFAGWCIEVTCVSFENKRFMNRGFLLGPYCPVYGSGAILITLLLKNFTNNPILLFVMAVLICAVLEYATSFFMEKLFHLRWWDYSKRKWNINGRICIGTMIPFGILGITMMYFTNPFLLDKINLLNENTLSVLFYTLLAIFIIDLIISIITIIGIKQTTAIVSKENRQDNTEEITKKVREILLSGKSFTEKRLLRAYPKLQSIKIKVKETLEHTKEEIEKQKRKIDISVKKTKKSIYKKINKK